LNEILDRARLEDFTISNEHRPVNEVAREMLVKAGWISAQLAGVFGRARIVDRHSCLSS
jgi:hypothetical protein